MLLNNKLTFDILQFNTTTIRFYTFEIAAFYAIYLVAICVSNIALLTKI